jgi:hypothetical protein
MKETTITMAEVQQLAICAIGGYVVVLRRE